MDQLKKEHFKAVHHCYAYRLGQDRTNFRVNDDGEPSGSAGKIVMNIQFITTLSIIVAFALALCLMFLKNSEHQNQYLWRSVLDTRPLTNQPLIYAPQTTSTPTPTISMPKP